MYKWKSNNKKRNATCSRAVERALSSVLSASRKRFSLMFSWSELSLLQIILFYVWTCWRPLSLTTILVTRCECRAESLRRLSSRASTENNLISRLHDAAGCRLYSVKGALLTFVFPRAWLTTAGCASWFADHRRIKSSASLTGVCLIVSVCVCA